MSKHSDIVIKWMSLDDSLSSTSSANGCEMGGRPKSIYDTAQGFFIIFKIMGLASYDFDRNPLKIRMKAGNYAQLCFSLAIWIYLAWIHIYENPYTKAFVTHIKSNILEGIWHHQFEFQFTLVPLFILNNFFNRHNLEVLLKKINSFDEKLSKLDWRFKIIHKRVEQFVIFGIFAVSISLLIIYIIVGNFIETMSKALGLSVFKVTFIISAFIVITEMFLLISVRFIACVYCVISRLTVLTKNMRWILVNI